MNWFSLISPIILIAMLWLQNFGRGFVLFLVVLFLASIACGATGNAGLPDFASHGWALYIWLGLNVLGLIGCAADLFPPSKTNGNVE